MQTTHDEMRGMTASRAGAIAIWPVRFCAIPASSSSASRRIRSIGRTCSSVSARMGNPPMLLSLQRPRPLNGAFRQS